MPTNVKYQLQGIWNYLKGIKERSEIEEFFPQKLWRKKFVECQNEEVQRLLMSCIIELSRIWNPGFPYQESATLKVILELCIQCLTLHSSDEAYLENYYNIVKWMASCKVFFIKCTQIREFEELFVELLDATFSALSFDSRVVKEEALELCCSLVEASCRPYLPGTLLSAVLRHIAAAHSNSSETQINNFSFANSIIAKKANTFKASIYKGKLYSKEITDRVEAVTFFGRIFSFKIRVANHHPRFWESFLERFSDKRRVAIQCIQMAPLLIECHHEYTDELMEELTKAGRSGSIEIRKQVVMSVNELTELVLPFISTHPKFWQLLKDMADDLEEDVRYCTLCCISDIYDRLINENIILKETVENIQWAGQKLLLSYNKSGTENKHLILTLVNGKLIPYKLPDEERMERLLKLLLPATESALLAYSALLLDQVRLNRIIFELIQVKKKKTQLSNENKLLIKLSELLPGESETKANLNIIFEHLFADENCLFDFLGIINPMTSHEQRIELLTEVIEKFDLGDEVASTMLSLLRSAAYTANTESLKILMNLIESEKLLQNLETDADKSNCICRSMDILKIFTMALPELFFNKEMLSYLASFVQSKSPAIFKALTYLSEFSQVREKMVEITEEHDLLTLCEEYMKNGPPKLVKESSRFLCSYFNEHEEIRSRQLNIIVTNLSSDSEADMIRGLIAVGHALSNMNIQIFKMILRKVKDMLICRRQCESLVDSCMLWCSKDELPTPILLKVELVSTFVRLILHLQDKEEIKENFMYLIEAWKVLILEGFSSALEVNWIYLTVGIATIKILNYHLSEELLILSLQFLSLLLSKVHHEAVELLLRKLKKYLFRGLSKDFTGLYSIVILRKDANLTNKSFSLFKAVLNMENGSHERLATEVGVEPGDPSDWTLHSLMMLSKCGALTVVGESLLACLKFAMEPLNFPKPVGYYTWLLDPAQYCSTSATHKRDYENERLRTLILTAIRRKKRN